MKTKPFVITTSVISLLLGTLWLSTLPKQAAQQQALSETFDSFQKAHQDVQACQEQLTGNRWTNRLATNLHVCFSKSPGPWSLNLDIVFRDGKPRLRDLRNAELFFNHPDVIRECIEMLIYDEITGVDQIFGEMRLSEQARYRVEKLTTNAEARVTTDSSCISFDGNVQLTWPHRREDSEIRDVVFLLGSPAEKDQVSKELAACEAKLKPGLRGRRILMRMLRETSAQGRTSYTVEDSDQSLGLTDDYTNCITQALSARANAHPPLDIPAPKLVVKTSDGKEVEMEAISRTIENSVRYWYLRQPGKPPRHYQFAYGDLPPQ